MIRSAKGMGLVLLCLAILFSALVMLFTVEELKPVTEYRISDCQSRIEDGNEQLAVAQTQKEIDGIKYTIKKYEGRAAMLQERETWYKACMIIIMAFLAAVIVYTQMFGAAFAAPAAALGILLTIGYTFRVIIWIDKSDPLFLTLALIAGIIAYTIFRRWHEMSRTIFILLTIAVIALLLANIFFGTERNGSKNWIVFGADADGNGGIGFQPSEFIKLFLIVMGAYAFGNKKRIAVYYMTTLFSCLVFVYLKDLGATVVIFALLLAMTILLLDKPSWLIAGVAFAIVALICAYMMFGYVRDRLDNFGHALEIDGSQQGMMLRALVFGGVTGLGIDQSSYIINFASVDSDMVIAGITSIYGIGMLIITMMCYASLVVLPMSNRSVHPTAYYIPTQAAIVIAVQVLLNFLGSIDLLPFTGVVAPFLSNGGSALVMFCTLFGLVFAALHPKVEKLKEDPRNET